jgi:hypothetical protein
MIHIHLPFHRQETQMHTRRRAVQAYGDDDKWQLDEQPSEEQLVAYLDEVVKDTSEK